MKILLKEKIVFLDMPKNASTSIDSALKEKTNISISGTPKLKHMTFREYTEFVIPILNHYYNAKMEVISLMREPIKWLNSWYRYRQRNELKNKSHPLHKNSTANITFEEFLEAFISKKSPPYANLMSQYEFLMEKDGSIGIDKVFLYEDLDKFEKYMNSKVKNFVLPRKNISSVKEAPFSINSSLRKNVEKYLSRDYALYNFLQQNGTNLVKHMKFN